MEKRKVYGTILGISLFVLVILGLTYAILQWTSSNSDNTNINLTVNKNLSNYIVYEQGNSILSTDDKELAPSEDYSSGISTTIEFYKQNTTKPIYGTIYMEILNMLSSSNTTDANIKKTNTLKWAITTYTSSNTTEVLVGEGTFKDRNIDDKFAIYQNFELSTTRTFFKIYIWYDVNAIDESLPLTNELLSVEISAEATDTLTGSYATLVNLGLTSNGVKDSFAEVATTDEGVFEAEDDLGTSYYFRGVSTNNYVKFANFYWRIIRINGDGSIRMIYDGTSAHENGEDSEDRRMGTTVHNESSDDNAYVGYMYGSAGASTYDEAHANITSSTIKLFLDQWYEENIRDTAYEEYVVDAIYCNDRKIDENAGSLNGYTGFTTLGYGTNETIYAAMARVGINISNPTPTLECAQSNDRFTVNDTLGNGDLTYPIGLITADEVTMAGGTFTGMSSGNTGYYLYMGSNYSTMTPFKFRNASVFKVMSTGLMNGSAVTNSGAGVRGVISIDGSALNAGTGTFDDPFEIIPEANSPDLVDGLIPIVYSTTEDSDGNITTKVLKADTTSSFQTTVTATCPKLGDVDGDGEISGMDAIIIYKIISGMYSKNLNNRNDSALVCADVNGDGIINEEDKNIIKQYVLGAITTFPVGTPLEPRTGTVTKNNQWYDYNNKVWANAILVKEEKRTSYQNYLAGAEINQDDILAYYVWIPRYKYKVWNIDKVVGTDSYSYSAQTTGIDIIFESGTTSTGTISCTYKYNVDSDNGGIDLSTTTAEKCEDLANSGYYTHPAFTFGNTELKGFWIGKYEVSSSNPSASNGGGNTTGLTVRILPNAYSWRGNTVSNQRKVIQDMQIESNIYGLSTSRTNTDSHMLTNMEWGAVAYLTYSKYGRCYAGSCEEVTINNCSSYITGIGADSINDSSSETTCTTAANKYNGDKGVQASTTGNIYGVYDMSGGAYDYVMGNMSSTSDKYTFYSNGSGLSNWYTDDTAKYVTSYAYGTSQTNQTAYNRSRLGDATGEVVLKVSSTGVGSWNDDNSYFPSSTSAWFKRGGYYNNTTAAGVFGFGIYNGGAVKYNSSRAALVSVRSN